MKRLPGVEMQGFCRRTGTIGAGRDSAKAAGIPHSGCTTTSPAASAPGTTTMVVGCQVTK